MRKQANPNDEYRVKPVKTIELSEKHLKLRIVIFIIAAAAAMFFIIFGIVQCSNVDSGFAQISSNFNLYDRDFTLMYNLGTKNKPNDDHKNVISLYDQALSHAYPLFDSSSDYDGINNMKYINDHPNIDIEVSPTLYKAFKQIDGYDTRILYQAPIHSLYLSMFLQNDDDSEYEYDPKNPEVLDWINSYLAYTNDDTKIHINLKENNTVELFVSEDYLEFAKDNGAPFIDFSYLTNAFLMDIIADTLITNGYTRGYISSCDGYFRSLSDLDSYTYSIGDKVEKGYLNACQMEIKKSIRGVCYRAYDLYPNARKRYYILSDGTVRSFYIDEATGISMNSCQTMMFYSEHETIVDIVLKSNKYYINTTIDEEGINSLSSSINTIYVTNNKVYYNDDITLKNLFDNGEIKYEGVKIS